MKCSLLVQILTLTSIPFLNDPTTIANLKKELPVYLAKCDSVSSIVNVLDWWKQNEDVLHNWSSVARKVLLIQPSSAAEERVFSLLNNYLIQYQTVQLARRLHRMLTAPSI